MLPQFRSDDWEYKEVKCITADRRIQTVVLNEDVLAVMRDNGKQGQAPDTLDDKYVLVCLCAELIVSEWLSGIYLAILVSGVSVLAIDMFSVCSNLQ